MKAENMKSKDVMTRDVVTIDKDERLERVLETMRKQRMSKIVVVEKDRLAGIITDGDIADELGSLKNRRVPASQLHASSAMRRNVPTVTPDTPVKECIETMLEEDMGMLPVTHDGNVVGVVTASDLLKLVVGSQTLGDFMTTEVHAVAPTDRVIHARRTMIDHHIERLPVLLGGKLVGILGEMDIAHGLARFKQTVRDNHQPSALQRFLVEDIFQQNVVTAPPEMTAAEAAGYMRKEDVGSLPVLSGGDRLVGIVTRSDLLRLIDLP